MEILQEKMNSSDFFNGEVSKRMKLPQKLSEKGIIDIYIQNKPRQFKIEYEFEGKPQKAISLPILEFPFPTVEPLKDLADGTMSIETVTEVMGFIILELSPHWNTIHNGNGNNDHDGLTDEYAESLNRASNRTIPKFEEDELKEISNRDYPGFIINAIKREVKRDDVLIRQVFYTALSAYTFEPINLGIISPTSEGKTYTTMKVVQYFPKQDVWLIGNMSDKALIRQKGILINSRTRLKKQITKISNQISYKLIGFRPCFSTNFPIL
jgi:hypothetical protein